MLSVVVLGELVIYSPPVQQAEHSLQVGVRAIDASPDSATIRISIAHATFPQDMRLVAFQLSTRPIGQPAIYVYTDPGFPTAGVVGTAVQGVFDHLAGELLAHGYSHPIVAVTAGDLATVFRQTDQAKGRAVVMMTGVMPASVFSTQLDLLAPWVDAGGLVVWGGASIGYYSAQPGQSLGDAAPLSYASRGPELLVGKGILTFPWHDRRIASGQGDMAAALGISYRLASAGMARNAVLGQAGVELGWSTGAFSSLMYLPRGAGGYVLFGGEILDEAEVSHDLAQVLLSSATSAAGPVVASQLSLSNSKPTADMDWHLPFGYSKGGIMLLVFDADPDGTFFFRDALNT